MFDNVVFYVAFGGAVVLSAGCSLFEAVLYSVTVGRIEELVQAKRRCGLVLRELRDDVQRPIAGILILNTIANTGGAFVAGAFFGKVFHSIPIGIFSAVFTLCILIFSEIVPKTIGVVYSRSLAPVIALPLRTIVWWLSPLIAVSRVMTKLISAGGVSAGTEAFEIEALASVAVRSGGIKPFEKQVITNILALDEQSVRANMTPRTVLFSVPKEECLRNALKLSPEWNYSRVPVYDGEEDAIVGLVITRHVFRALAANQGDRTFGDLMQPIHFVPDTARLDVVFHEFLERRQHLFGVVDEYGAVRGVITLEDVLEEIVGREIVDELDTTVDMQAEARRRQRMRDLDRGQH